MKQIFTRLKSHNYLKYQKSIQSISEKYQVESIQQLNVLSSYKPIDIKHFNSEIDIQQVWLNFLKIQKEIKVKNGEYQLENQDQKFNLSNVFQFNEKSYNLEFSSGVRPSLYEIISYIIKRYQNQIDKKIKFIFPKDVYPVYQLIAQELGIKNDQIEFYDTYQQRQNKNENQDYQLKKKIQSLNQKLSEKYDQQNGDQIEVLLVADPNIIADQQFDENNLYELEKWLDFSSQRILILDTVYNLDFQELSQKYKFLLQKQRNVFIMYSLSKSYQLPLTFGINIVPSQYCDLKFIKPNLEQLNKVQNQLEQNQYLPQIQVEKINQNWELLKFKLNKIDQFFQPPKVPGNYLGIINKGIEDLYKEDNLLAVSPSVYDIENQDEKLSVISSLQSFEKMYHVTVLSNFSIGFDKYSMTYSKENLEKSTFKNQFYLLTGDELEIGFQKSDKLLKKLNLKDNQRIILCTTSDYIQKSKNKLKKNQNTGLGYYIDDNKIKISELYIVDDNGKMKPISVEDAYALSMKINQKKLHSYQDLVPRTISILPVAQGCQAKCPFCFSHTSVSKDVKQKILNKEIIEATLKYAKQRGAERAVITGGGEPTMLPFHYIIKLIKHCKQHFDRVIMITNGYNLGHIETEQERKAALQALDEAGLNILAVSRHDITTKKLMNLETKSHKIAKSLQGMQFLRNLKLRWVCVIQKGGVQDEESLVRYLDDVVETGGCDQINFKELYVASSQESVYYEEEGNEFCRKNQVSLSLITEFLDKNNAKILSKLPWGSPVYELNWKGKILKIAAYTEPTVYWERSQGICRSWNLMADAQCFVSLEDKNSLIDINVEQILNNENQVQNFQNQQQEQYN